MHRGFVKIHRKMQGSVFYHKPEYLAVWIHLLLEATHKDHRQLIGSQVVELKPGQLVTGRKAISSATGVSEMKCFRILKCLENVQQIEQQTFTKYSIISITNWHKYQIDEQQIAQQMNNRCTTDEQQMNTNKNVKNEKNNNKGVFHPPTLEEVIQLCQERNKGVDPVKWFYFYQGKGWMVGKNKMKDWKGAIRTWEKEAEIPANEKGLF